MYMLGGIGNTCGSSVVLLLWVYSDSQHALLPVGLIKFQIVDLQKRDSLFFHCKHGYQLSHLLPSLSPSLCVIASDVCGGQVWAGHARLVSLGLRSVMYI